MIQKEEEEDRTQKPTATTERIWAWKTDSFLVYYFAVLLAFRTVKVWNYFTISKPQECLNSNELKFSVFLSLRSELNSSCSICKANKHFSLILIRADESFHAIDLSRTSNTRVLTSTELIIYFD